MSDDLVNVLITDGFVKNVSLCHLVTTYASHTADKQTAFPLLTLTNDEAESASDRTYPRHTNTGCDKFDNYFQYAELWITVRHTEFTMFG